MPGWMKWGISILVGLAIIVVGFRYAGPVLTAFFVINCLVLVTVVLLQSGKAADLAGAFGGAGSQTAFGPRGAATILSQATTWCAIMFMICAMALVLRTDKAVENGSMFHEGPKSAPAKIAPPITNTPGTPGQTPAPAPQTNSTPATSAPAASQPAPVQPTPKKP